MKSDEYPVIIVGAGIAGLSTALRISELRPELEVLVLAKTALWQTSSAMAQGGVAARMCGNSIDRQRHIDDTLKAGKEKNNLASVAFLVDHIEERIRDLERLGLSFDHINDEYDYALEGGHSQKRILHTADSTGASILNTLWVEASKKRNITFQFGASVVRLLKQDGCVVGLDYFNTQTKLIYTIYTQQVVLATGGLGQLFETTTNPIGAIGSGVALAYRVDAKVDGMQYIQFHPTALLHRGLNPAFLISEAVRGAGAWLVNEKGERFMFRYDARGELATRDIVSAAIHAERRKVSSGQTYLDMRHMDRDAYTLHFPVIVKTLQGLAIQPERDLIPVTPAAHFQCGGIVTDLNGQTSVIGLYAVGECANNGLHGANRLASNSLSEGLVFGWQVGSTIAPKLNGATYNSRSQGRPFSIGEHRSDVVIRLRHTLTNAFHSLESDERLQAIDFCKSQENPMFSDYSEMQLDSIALVSRLILEDKC